MAVGANGVPVLPDAFWSVSGQHGVAGAVCGRSLVAVVRKILVVEGFARCAENGTPCEMQSGKLSLNHKGQGDDERQWSKSEK